MSNILISLVVAFCPVFVALMFMGVLFGIVLGAFYGK